MIETLIRNPQEVREQAEASIKPMAREEIISRIEKTIEEAVSKFSNLVGVPDFKRSVNRYLQNHENLDFGEAIEQTVLRALDMMSQEEEDDFGNFQDVVHPNWTFIATHIYLEKLYEEASAIRGYDSSKRYGSLYELLVYLTEAGIYNPVLLERYSKEEIADIEAIIEPQRDYSMTYVGLRTFAGRYLAKPYTKLACELPQEHHIVIAMDLMCNEPKEKRLELIKEEYLFNSFLDMTVATPTLANAAKTYGQYSSCFIDMIDDDLQSIYDSNTDVANLSKNGGGIGVYMGKIRSHGSDIKGFPGVSSGVIPWMKQLNNTAVSVDQLGQRKGAISVYLDVWHKDIFSFLDAKLNNGDERYRTHDLFTGVCIPDVFMERVEAREDWYIFDPHTVEHVLGFRIEDSYDEKKGEGTFRNRYAQAVEAALDGKFGKQGLLWDVIPAINIMKRIMKSQLETGTPFMFYRDEVNRKNPNKHAGMIYCTNLCTEITQNQSPTTLDVITYEDGSIVKKYTPGDFVVCNLSSINLGGLYARVGEESFYETLERLIKIQVRMLDNVIELNHIPVKQAELTNQKYRAIGGGTYGWHYLLALKKIPWNSPKAVEFSDELYEHIAYYFIKASHELALEKGSYPMFEGSDWHTGQYFVDRGYITEYGDNESDTRLDWAGLAHAIQEGGLRNGYLMAVAPNATTALIGGSTPSIDPIFKRFYSEEKKDYKIPVAAPGLSPETMWFYQSAYLVDQKASIRQNAARQRHVDQAISFNLYVSNDVQASELLDYHLTAWSNDCKTSYYVRSTAQAEIEDCESCSS